MTDFPYQMIPEEDRKPTIGLIVLQSDETVEPEIHQWLPPTRFDVLVSRVPSGEEVTGETLGAMANHIKQSADLFPRSASFDVVAYCCTSGTSVIGADRVAELVSAGCKTKGVTDPVTALVAACKRRNIKRLAFLSPYIESVSAHLRDVISAHGLELPVFGTFNEGEEARVAWIDRDSIRRAVKGLVAQDNVEGVFLSCTNLKTFGLIDELERECQLPVMSSNSVLAEHLEEIATS